MKRILITLFGMALMLGQSSSPTGMAGAAATSTGNQVSSSGVLGSVVDARFSGKANGSEMDSQSITAIGAVVAGVAAVSGN